MDESEPEGTPRLGSEAPSPHADVDLYFHLGAAAVAGNSGT